MMKNAYDEYNAYDEIGKTAIYVAMLCQQGFSEYLINQTIWLIDW